METGNKRMNWQFYLVVLIFSAAFLFFGNRIASRDMFVSEFDAAPVYAARVTAIEGRHDIIPDAAWGIEYAQALVFFEAEITSRGDRRGQTVPAEQFVSSRLEQEVAIGDRILLIHDEFHDIFFFMEFQRIHFAVILGVVFFVLIVLFGKMKGFNSIISLGFICMAVFMVFVPAILSGRNIYVAAIVICVYAVISTLLIVIGPNKKAYSAIVGCLGGILVAGLLMFAMDAIMGLTGLVDHEARNLLNIPTARPIDLRAIIFAGVIIGSTGAIMDVAMSIASSLWEIKQVGEESSFGSIFRSGMEIGKDILGTMLNTLILAYIGSSLSLIVLIVASTTTMLELLNTELIIVELLRALVGSFGMFMTIPLTAAFCGWSYLHQKRPDPS